MKKRLFITAILMVIFASAISITAYAHTCSYNHNSGQGPTTYENPNSPQHTRVSSWVKSCTFPTCDNWKYEYTRTPEDHRYVYNSGTHNSNKTHTFVGTCVCTRKNTLTKACPGPPCVVPQSVELDVD